MSNLSFVSQTATQAYLVSDLEKIREVFSNFQQEA